MHTIKHPMSFWMTVAVVVITAALTVAFNMIHVIGLAVDIVMLVGLRSLAIWEGRRNF